MVSQVLEGGKTVDDMVTHDASWYRETGVNCRFGEPVVKIDRARKRVISASGVTQYDKLVIATGSASFFIPVAGNDFPGVFGLRALDDGGKMLEAAGKTARNAVIIGGGMLGLEGAAALNEQGVGGEGLRLMGHRRER